MGNYEQALTNLEKYYRMNVELADEHCIGIAHRWYGSIFSDQGDLDKALDIHRTVLKEL